MIRRFLIEPLCNFNIYDESTFLWSLYPFTWLFFKIGAAQIAQRFAIIFGVIAHEFMVAAGEIVEACVYSGDAV